MAVKLFVGLLQFKFENGMIFIGRIRFKMFFFDIKLDVQDMDVYQVGQVIVSFQLKLLYIIIRSNNFEFLY